MNNLTTTLMLLLAKNIFTKDFLFVKNDELQWDEAYITPGATGYYIYYGVKPGEYIEKVRSKGMYIQKFDLRKLPLKENITYYLSVTTYIGNNICDRSESHYSNEVIYKLEVK